MLAAEKRVGTSTVATGEVLVEVNELVGVHERRSWQAGDCRDGTAEETKSRPGTFRSATTAAQT